MTGIAFNRNSYTNNHTSLYWNAPLIVCCHRKWRHFLSYWGRVTHICIRKLTAIGSDNGLSPGRRQAIIWTNAEILLIGSLGTNFNEIFIKIQKFSFKKIHLKMLSGKWHPCCLGLNVLTLFHYKDCLFVYSAVLKIRLMGNHLILIFGIPMMVGGRPYIEMITYSCWTKFYGTEFWRV